MGIKNKKNVPEPVFTERWQAIASTGNICSARNQYRISHPDVPLVKAHRIVADWMSQNGYNADPHKKGEW